MDNAQRELSSELIEIIVCPIDKGSLEYIAQESVLYNSRLKKAYEIIDSIPVLLAEKAYDVDEDTQNKYSKLKSTTTGPQ